MPTHGACLTHRLRKCCRETHIDKKTGAFRKCACLFFEMLKWRTSGTLMADAGRDPGTLRCAPCTGLLQSFVAPRRRGIKKQAWFRSTPVLIDMRSVLFHFPSFTSHNHVAQRTEMFALLDIVSLFVDLFLIDRCFDVAYNADCQRQRLSVHHSKLLMQEV